MNRIKIAIAGIGNCASALIQGIEYYKQKNSQDAIGFMHWDIGGYKPGDIEVVTAFDIDGRKVGKDVTEAIFQPPNCTKEIYGRIPPKGVTVKMGRVLLLGPLVLVIAALVHKQGRSRGALLPWFIVGFFLLSALSSFGLIPTGVADPLRELGRWLLTVSMAAIGLRIRMRALLMQGPRALLGSAIVVAGQVAALWALASLL